MDVAVDHTLYNGANKISELESYEVVTVDRGYHVYVSAYEAAVWQTLPCR